MSGDGLGTALHLVGAVVGIFSIICRAAHMSTDTLLCVRMQHAALLAGLVFSLVLPGAVGTAALTAGVLGWLIIGAPRWKYGAPDWVQVQDGQSEFAQITEQFGGSSANH